MDAVPVDSGQPETAIVITASRLPEGEPVAASTLFEEPRIQRLGAPTVADYLRLAPSASVSTSGPQGSLTEVRIRGSEANHTLLFVDGIRANDPAAGSTPRFELLNANLAGTIALVRGPQSALWGSEAIGGIVAVDAGHATENAVTVESEAGSFGFGKIAAGASAISGQVSFRGAIAHQQAAGIDSFGGNGDRDGFANTVVRGLVDWRLSPSAKLTMGGFHLQGQSDFDGFDPMTFLRADTTDESRNRLTAGRVAIALGTAQANWSGSLSASLLGSQNRNFLAGQEQNRTRGTRFNLEGQINHRFVTGPIDHRLALGLGHERENFEADDISFGGFTKQDRSREHRSLSGEWRTSFRDRASASLAIRRDVFNRFRDATSIRAAIDARPLKVMKVGIAYAEGIAQPSFFELYGFFPGSFIGNPSLKPEGSRGWEASIHLSHANWSIALVGYRQRLNDEIVDTFDNDTFLSSAINSQGKSRRQGIEMEASWTPKPWLSLHAAYSYLDADQPTNTARVREARRPEHSGSVSADGAAGKFTYGASIAYVGKRRDTDFDRFPSSDVALSPYWLAGARVAYALQPRVEVHGRIANAFDDRYQDVVGYRAEGRSVFAGLRINFGS